MVICINPYNEAFVELGTMKKGEGIIHNKHVSATTTEKKYRQWPAAKPSEQLHAFQKETNLRDFATNPELFFRCRILQWQSPEGFSKEKILIQFCCCLNQ